MATDAYGTDPIINLLEPESITLCLHSPKANSHTLQAISPDMFALLIFGYLR